jgi:hypothetical protein
LRLFIPLLPALLLVACAGAAPAPTGTAAATPTQPQATSTGVPTVAPTVAATVGATTGSSGADMCSLLTVAEVAAASGETLDTATPNSDSLYSYCTYSGNGSENVRTWLLTDPAAVTSVFGTMKINAGSPVAGVGDEAWWSTDDFQPGLYILTGGKLAYISGSVDGPQDPIIALGKVLVTRL